MSIDGLKFTIPHVTHTLEELKQDLVKREAQMTELGDVYVDFEHDLECLCSEGWYSPDMAQLVALEAELEQISIAIEEQVNLLS